MAISSITSSPVAYRTPAPPTASLNAVTQPSSTPQQTGRAHHHKGGGNPLSASTAQAATASTEPGSLLDTLI